MSVHPSAVIDRRAVIDPTVLIGPYVVIDGPVRIGPNCRIGASAVILGNTQIGSRCQIHSRAVVGDLPQDHAFAGARAIAALSTTARSAKERQFIEGRPPAPARRSEVAAS